MKEKVVPDLFIEKLLLDELPRSTKEQLLKDPAVQRRLEELRADNQRILEEYPPEEMVKAIRNRSRLNAQPETEASRTKQVRPARKPLGWPRIVPAAGFALLVLVGGVLLITRGPDFFAPQTVARLKGGAAHLNVYMKTEEGPELLEEGRRVSAGTTLQIGYVSGTGQYGVILSIDGRGTVTLHFPLSAVSTQNLEGGGEVLLPFSYTLDDAPEFERFFFVVSEKPVSVETVIRAAEEMAEKPEAAKSQNLPLPAKLEQSSILLLK